MLGVRYEGSSASRPTSQVVSALGSADRIVVCPANPVTSIGPMLAVPGLRRQLRRAGGRVVGVSPMEGRAPYSGPAGKLMKATGATPDSYGVAKLYSDFMECILIAEGDAHLGGRIRALGMDPLATSTRMEGPSDELRLARKVMKA